MYLELPLPQLVRRLADLHVRGVVMARGQTLEGLFAERQGLYRQYADVTVPCDGLTQDQVVADVLKRL